MIFLHAMRSLAYKVIFIMVLFDECICVLAAQSLLEGEFHLYTYTYTLIRGRCSCSLRFQWGLEQIFLS